jgi:hypothetical protein
MKILSFILCSILLGTLTGCVSPIQTPEENKKNNDLLAKQISQLSIYSFTEMSKNASLDEVSRSKSFVKGIYFGIALDGASPAFEGDIKRVEELLFTKIATGPSLLLSNNSATVQIYPRADFNTIPTAAKAIETYIKEFESSNIKANKIDKNSKQSLLTVINFSSHGRKNQLHTRIGSNRIQGEITGEYLQKILADIDGLNRTPMLLIISACYSGSFIPLLAAPNRIIITAAASDKSSFGCGPTSKNTVFTQFLLDEEIDKNLSLNDFFTAALKRITTHENKMKFSNSLPQISVGENMKDLYNSPIYKWADILNK